MDLRIKQRIVGILVLAVFAVIILTVISGGSSSPEEDPALSAKSLPAQPEVLQLPVPQQQQAPQISSQAAQSIQPQAQGQLPTPQNVNQANTQAKAVPVAMQVAQQQQHQAAIPIENHANTQQQPVQQAAGVAATQPSTAANTHAAVLSSEQEQAPIVPDVPKSRKAIVVPAKPQVIKAHTNKEKKPSASAAKNANKTASAIATGWMVQLGSFSNTKNAKALVKALRAKGFSAHAVMAKNAQGKAIMRVFVGPEAVRAKAVKVQKRLQNEQNIAGIVIKTDVR